MKSKDVISNGILKSYEGTRHWWCCTSLSSCDTSQYLSTLYIFFLFCFFSHFTSPEYSSSLFLPITVVYSLRDIVFHIPPTSLFTRVCHKNDALLRKGQHSIKDSQSVMQIKRLSHYRDSIILLERQIQVWKRQ
jgi:hypothetical protein